MNEFATAYVEQEAVLPAVSRLARDMATAAKTLTAGEARFLVDAYYSMQESRIRYYNQVRALSKPVVEGQEPEPHAIFGWLASQNEILEEQVKRALGVYAKNHPVGQWALGQVGIGPVIAAGLLAHIDIRQANTVSSIWSYAGLQPGQKWLGTEKAAKIVQEVLGDEEPTAEKIAEIAVALRRRPEVLIERARGSNGELSRKQLAASLAKRPWNSELKTLCWKIGESFVKVSGKPNAFYGKMYASRKALEKARNEEGLYREQAEQILKEKRIGKDTDAYAAYIQGKLPDGQIHARAKRWAVKLFLAHLHEVWYKQEFGKAPADPYPIRYLGHADKIEPPMGGESED